MHFSWEGEQANKRKTTIVRAYSLVVVPGSEGLRGAMRGIGMRPLGPALSFTALTAACRLAARSSAFVAGTSWLMISRHGAVEHGTVLCCRWCCGFPQAQGGI
jgi:hypothetical protein